ncbi:MAG: hypothetical protein JJV89_01035, partial [Desulfosarcina sp.]|nr:hypothetical protein [Desulfobacterales bacterium]
IDGEKIFFGMPGSGGWFDCKQSCSIEDFLSSDKDFKLLPGKTSNISIDLLIVPDHWISQKSYKFNSKNRAVRESFIKRKLKLKSRKISGIENFFEYELYHTDAAEQFLRVYFLDEPKFFLIHEKFLLLNIQLGKITSYAFLWQQKLDTIPKFSQSETGFIHLAKDASALYFYSKGRFVFSRNTKLIDDTDISQNFDLLIYEINQSLHLFSQQSKKDIDRFYLLSGNEQDASLLSEKLGTEVLRVDFCIPGQPALQENAEDEIFSTCFKYADLDHSGSLLSIRHQDVKNDEKWGLFLKTGIIAGILFFLLMVCEAVYISKTSRFQIKNKGKEIQPSIAMEKTIGNFSESIDQLTTEINRPDYQNLIIKIIASISGNIRLNDIKIETDTVKQVYLKGVVNASGHFELQNRLSIFLSSLKKKIKSAEALSLDDINIKDFESSAMGKNKFYDFEFSFNLS